jgi:hypothetical protein
MEGSQQAAPIARDIFVGPLGVLALRVQRLWFALAQGCLRQHRSQGIQATCRIDSFGKATRTRRVCAS